MAYMENMDPKRLLNVITYSLTSQATFCPMMTQSAYTYNHHLASLSKHSEQNCEHVAEDILKCISWIIFFAILFKFGFKFDVGDSIEI